MRACHDVGDKAKNKVGPLLNGLVGRKSGTIPGYNYSDANKSSGIIWDDAKFLEYIKDPKAIDAEHQDGFSPASRTRPRPRICGPTSSNSMPTARRSERHRRRCPACVLEHIQFRWSLNVPPL